MNDATRRLPAGCVTRLLRTLAATTPFVIAGCHVTVDPIRVEPIHLTLDITLKVDRELDRFFDFEDPGALPANDAAPPAPGPDGEKS